MLSHTNWTQKLPNFSISLLFVLETPVYRQLSCPGVCCVQKQEPQDPVSEIGFDELALWIRSWVPLIKYSPLKAPSSAGNFKAWETEVSFMLNGEYNHSFLSIQWRAIPGPEGWLPFPRQHSSMSQPWQIQTSKRKNKTQKTKQKTDDRYIQGNLAAVHLFSVVEHSPPYLKQHALKLHLPEESDNPALLLPDSLNYKELPASPLSPSKTCHQQLQHEISNMWARCTHICIQEETESHVLTWKTTHKN